MNVKIIPSEGKGMNNISSINQKWVRVPVINKSPVTIVF